jgi:ferredoxin-NADP reductase
VLQILAVLLIGTVLLQGLLSLYSFARRISQQEQIYRAEKLRWEQRIETVLQRKVQQEQAEQSWSGYRKFEIRRKVREAENISSYYLTPHDRKPLPIFRPGQYLTFRLNIPGQRKPVIRCYSLSEAPNPKYYRVTIKFRVPADDEPHAVPGLASNYFQNVLKDGDILDVSAPAGNFYLDTSDDRPVVLIAGGVGLTPILSMLNSLHSEGGRRECWLFYGVNNGSEVLMREHLQKLAEGKNNFRLRLCYSNPTWQDIVTIREHLRTVAQHKRDPSPRLRYGSGTAQDAMQKSNQLIGRVSTELLRAELPSSNYQFYLCGPTAMMKDLVAGLTAWGVPEADIFYETFQPASIKPNNKPSEPSANADIEVTFSKSGKTVKWDSQAASLLELADNNDIPMEAGCRSGHCGTCLVAIHSGEVDYVSEPQQMPEAGSCLACITVPKTNLTVDA